MQPGKSSCRAALPASAAAALAALCALTPTAALGAATPPRDGALSARLAELAEPAVRTAPPARQAEALSLAPEGPGSLLREGNRVLVEARFDQGAAAGVDELRQAGAKVLTVVPSYRTATVAVRPDQLRALNDVPGMAGARELLEPITAAAECPSGEVVSEGVQQLHAGEGEYGEGEDEARKAFGVDGSGVTVGILSDSFDRATAAADGSGPVATHAADDVADGDLPGVGNPCGAESEVAVLEDAAPKVDGADEGRAMAQIVHDVAPGASLAFATAFTPDMFGFKENIEALAEPGGPEAQVIVDDVVFFEEPFFQEGPVAAAVRKVTGEGVAYLSAAGNDNVVEKATGNEIGSWEAQQFRDAGSCPPGLIALSEQIEDEEGFGLNPTHCMDFHPGAPTDTDFGLQVAPHGTLSVDLQWAEPWYGVDTDLDVFLLDSAGTPIAGSVDDNVNSSEKPFEIFQWENESASTATVQLAINRYAGDLPRLKFALIQSDVTATEYPRSSGTDVVGPTVFGHSGSVDAISVGAAPFDDGSTIEPYSSRGPVTHYFGPTDGTAPAAPLGAPQVLSKPQIAATDCGATSFFASWTGSTWRFCGTSAAAPHAAGVAALMLDEQTASPGDVRNALLAGSVPVGAFGACAAGAGLVDAVGSLEALIHSTAADAPSCSAPDSDTPPEEEEPGAGTGAGASPPPSGGGGTVGVAPLATAPSEGAAHGLAPEPPPTTFFRRRPPKLILTRHRSVMRTFAFASDQSEVSFLCKVDRGGFRPCGAQFARRYPLGRHVLRVKAQRQSDGATDATPAIHRFRVKRVRR